ncbi:MAG TPA: TolC family protein [Chryseolinea sp.]|nr:TolC family protein [Chryseolinea sp.]
MKIFVILLIFLSFSCGAAAQQRSLSYFLEQGKQNNPYLKDFENQSLSNKIDSQLLRATSQTQVGFINNNSYAPVIRGYGYDEAITNIANVTAIVQASHSIIGRKNMAEQYRSFHLQTQALADTIQLAEQDLFRVITDQYITAYGDQLTVAFNREVYDLMQQEDSILRKLTQSGAYKQTDYLTFYVTLQQQELIYQQSIFLYNTDYLTINYLCGITDTTVQSLQKPDITDSTSYDINQSVFYRRYTTDSLRLENQKALIGFEYKPKLGVYTDAGYNSSLQTTPYKNFGFSAGVNLTVPIYDGHQRRMKYSKTALQEKTRQSNRDFFLAQYHQQVAQLRQQLRSIDGLEAKINHQISYAYTLIKANNKMLQSGDIAMKDYITAINNYLTAKNLLTQNSVSRLKIISQLNYWNRQ